MSSGSELELDDDVVSVSATKDDIEKAAKLNRELHELLQKCIQISSEIAQLQQPTIVELPQDLFLQSTTEHQPPEGLGTSKGRKPKMPPRLATPTSLLVSPAILQLAANKESQRGLVKSSLEEMAPPLPPIEQEPAQENPEELPPLFSSPIRRVMVLGLCTTADIVLVPSDEYNAFRRRLERVLLWTTSETMMDHHPNPADSAPPSVCLSKQFEFGVLSAFADFGLNLSKRLGVRGTVTEHGGREVIVSDANVDALLWMKGLLADTKLGPISRREITLSANHMRSRLIGQPVSPVLMREYLWRTLTSTILYLEGRGMY